MANITFYGTRGASSLTSSKYQEFGGATTCIFFNINNTNIMVDCGSGISNALEDIKKFDELHIFISHSHLDHICGIPTLLAQFEGKIYIYGKTYEGVSIEGCVNKVMNQSLWPVRASTYKNVRFINLEEDLVINGINVTTMTSNHPGGCTLYRFDYRNDTIVTAFDFCHLDGYDLKLLEFARGCSTLIYDGTFTEDELKEKVSWGHSTPLMGAKIGKDLGCKEVFITHFGLYDDEYLNNWEQEIQTTYPFVKFARGGAYKNDLTKMIEIGTMLSTEKDNNILLSKIVESSMDITGADGGTLYLLDKDKLDFKVLINKSKNTRLIKTNEDIGLPSVPLNGKNISATAAREKRLINVVDCYSCVDYDFSGSKDYDKLNSYHTQSVIALPLIDEFDDVIGVLQLINAKDKENNVTSFKKQDEEMLKAIANQACISIVNTSYSQKINDLLYGFVKVMSVEIDERTPYNANHTRNMVRFAENFFEYEDKIDGKYKVESKKKREILMSIWLHDIGKILTPIDIMNKDSRLGDLTSVVEARFERRFLLLKLALASGEINKEKYDELEEERTSQLAFIQAINKVGFLDGDLKEKLDELSAKNYQELDGSFKPIITNEEYHELCIVKGTLTKEERGIMEGHVSYTQKFLSQLDFPKYYDMIPTYAGNHHEFLNGSGYPNHLTEKDLPWPCRLITVCDIFEALVAKDRPYKKPMSDEKALSILKEMVEMGKLDKDIVLEFENSKCWLENN